LRYWRNAVTSGEKLLSPAAVSGSVLVADAPGLDGAGKAVTVLIGASGSLAAQRGRGDAANHAEGGLLPKRLPTGWRDRR
jgi:hypothetical protein